MDITEPCTEELCASCDDNGLSDSDKIQTNDIHSYAKPMFQATTCTVSKVLLMLGLESVRVLIILHVKYA